MNWADPIAAGLSGLWLFDDPGDSTNGGTQWDLCRRYNGTHNAGSDTVTSSRGRVVQLNGSTGFIKVSNFLLRSGGTGVTMAIWAYSTDFAQNMMLIEKTLVNASYEMFCTDPSGSSLFYLRGGSATSLATPLPSNSAWHHFLCTIDGSGNGTIYIDGEAKNAGGISAPVDPAGDLYIGCYDATGYLFNGLLDMPAVWNRALSAAEVARLYADPYGLIEKPSARLVVAVGAAAAVQVPYQPKYLWSPVMAQ